jgi:hypothetical protein
MAMRRAYEHEGKLVETTRCQLLSCSVAGTGAEDAPDFILLDVLVADHRIPLAIPIAEARDLYASLGRMNAHYPGLLS